MAKRTAGRKGFQEQIDDLTRRVEALERKLRTRESAPKQPERRDLGSPIVESDLQRTMLGIDDIEKPE